MNKTAFVTGGTGFLGLNLIEQLTAGGWHVVALRRQNSNVKYLSALPVELALGDIVDARSVLTAMPEQVDAVFHVAGDVSLWKGGDAMQDRVNIGGTQNVVDAALARRARRFIHTSSISAYGAQTGRINKATPQLGGQPWINYQRSKFMAEEVVRAAIPRGLEAVIMNPASIMGRGDVTGWARIIRMAVSGKLPGVPSGALSFCHGGEVARAHITAFAQGRCGENYLLGGTDASFVELARDRRSDHLQSAGARNAGVGIADGRPDW